MGRAWEGNAAEGPDDGAVENSEDEEGDDVEE